LDLGDVERGLRDAGEPVLDDEQQRLRPLLELLPLLLADGGAPRGLAVLVVHLAVPDDDRRLDPVLEVQDLVLRRQVHRRQEVVRVELHVGDDPVQRVPEAGPPVLSAMHGKSLFQKRFNS
jgi:hypothetical protein